MYCTQAENKKRQLDKITQDTKNIILHRRVDSKQEHRSQNKQYVNNRDTNNLYV